MWSSAAWQVHIMSSVDAPLEDNAKIGWLTEKELQIFAYKNAEKLLVVVRRLHLAIRAQNYI
jgi:hypothetical protein